MLSSRCLRTLRVGRLPGRSLRTLGLGLLFGQALLASEAAGQDEWAFTSAVATVDLTDPSGAARVTLRYELTGAEEGALPLGAAVPIELLGIGPATARRVETDRDSHPVILWPVSGTRRAAALRTPSEWGGASYSVTLTYTVEEALEERGERSVFRVPLVTGPIPTETSEGFDLTLHLPEGWAVLDAFPSGLRTDDEGVWTASLSVVPAYVRLNVATDGRWRPGLPHLIDVLTILILGGFALVGWRHLRRVAEAAA